MCGKEEGRSIALPSSLDRPAVGSPEADGGIAVIIWFPMRCRTSVWYLMLRRRSLLRWCKAAKQGPVRACLGQRQHVALSVLKSRVVHTIGPKHECMIVILHMHVYKNVFVCGEVWP